MPWSPLTLLLTLLVPFAVPVETVAVDGVALAGPVAATGWRLPVAGAELAGPFSYDRARPFRAGQRRGVDLRVRPGARVGSACSGRVTYAGIVPRRGRGVTVRCGALLATHLGLAALAVRRGTAVAAGRTLGWAGASGLLRLGARAAGDRWGWRDPLALVGPVPGPAPLAPGGRAPRAPRVPRAPVRPRAPTAPRAPHAPLAPRSAPWPAPAAIPPWGAPVRDRAPTPAPLAALLWLAVGLLALGLGVHGGVWRSRPGRAIRAALSPRRAGGDA